MRSRNNRQAFCLEHSIQLSTLLDNIPDVNLKRVNLVDNEIDENIYMTAKDKHMKICLMFENGSSLLDISLEMKMGIDWIRKVVKKKSNKYIQRAFLSKEQIELIRNRYLTNTVTSMSKELSIPESTIWNVIQRLKKEENIKCLS